MASSSGGQPVYIDQTFGMFHAPAGPADGSTAVLMCGPWGWDEVASHRSRRAWADHLAERGYPTLRVDLPGTGDSAGSPGDADMVPAWTASLTEAARWLTTTTRSRRVTALGLGLGGLLAGVAAAEGAPIDGLALWAAPSEGRQLLRALRAFARLQSTQYGHVSDAGDQLPDGWQEIGGFAMSAGTIADLAAIDLRGLDFSGVERALLLDRDGIAIDERLRGRLADAGADVTVASGSGWAAMCFHPERYKPPVETFAVLDEWLAGAASVPRPRQAASEPARHDAADHAAPAGPSDHADLLVDGVQIRETPLQPVGGSSTSFGILAAPTNGPATDVCAVYLNAGAVRRIGPNRMWVEGARRWAAAGIPTLRVDVIGIGDADGDADMYYDVERFYTPDRDAHVASILDALEARGLGPRFVLIGLCAGAYAAFTVAASDPRVVEAVVVNPRIMVWDPAILRRRDAQVVSQVFDVGLWRKVISGETSAARLMEIGQAAAAEASIAVRRQAARLRGAGSAEPWVMRLETMLDRVRDNGARVVLAFSGDEPMRDEMEAAGLMEHLDRWPNVVAVPLPGNDHTLRPIPAQRAFHRLLDAELTRITGARV